VSSRALLPLPVLPVWVTGPCPRRSTMSGMSSGCWGRRGREGRDETERGDAFCHRAEVGRHIAFPVAGSLRFCELIRRWFLWAGVSSHTHAVVSEDPSDYHRFCKHNCLFPIQDKATLLMWPQRLIGTDDMGDSVKASTA
jgi:hypothetical protein